MNIELQVPEESDETAYEQVVEDEGNTEGYIDEDDEEQYYDEEDEVEDDEDLDEVDDEDGHSGLAGAAAGGRAHRPRGARTFPRMVGRCSPRDCAC